MMQLTISGYSTALFSTWYFIEELSLLFDAGDGVTSALLQKSRKIKSVFISHADRDHVTGLLQLNQLNARPGLPKIYYPKDSLSFKALEEFSKNFDRQVKATEWIPLTIGETVEIKKDVLVTSFKNMHVDVPGAISKSLSYIVQQRKRKLREQFLQLSGEEIRNLRNTHNEDETTYEVRENILGYSGDTPVADFSIWDNTHVLIHESTFLHRSEIDDTDDRRNKHSVLEEVLEAASQINLGTLILGHFSSRYKNEEIDDCIKSCCKKFNISFPVYRVLPGAFMHDITSGCAINKA